MTMLKRFLVLGISTLMLAGFSTSVFAGTTTDVLPSNMLSIDGGFNYEINEDGIPIFYVNSEEEAEQLKQQINNAPIVFEELEPVTLDSQQRDLTERYEKHAKIAMITIKLKTDVTVSKDIIVDTNAFSLATGFTGVGRWDEASCTSKIKSTKKGFISTVDGVLVYGIHTPVGSIEMISRDVSFDDDRDILL